MFKKVYEEPIVKSKQPTASNLEKEIGEARSDEVSTIRSLCTAEEESKRFDF